MQNTRAQSKSRFYGKLVADQTHFGHPECWCGPKRTPQLSADPSGTSTSISSSLPFFQWKVCETLTFPFILLCITARVHYTGQNTVIGIQKQQPTYAWLARDWAGEVDASIHRPGRFLTVYGKEVVKLIAPLSLCTEL